MAYADKDITTAGGDSEGIQVEDRITYQTMIPAFHFDVSFMKEKRPEDDEPAKPAESGEGNEVKEQEEDPQDDPIAFSDVGGLGLELQTEDFVEGGENGTTIRLPKPPKARNLTLKRALSATPKYVIRWARKALEDFDFEPMTVVVSIIDPDSQPVKTWKFQGAFPVKLSLSDLSSSKNEIVIETLELAYRKVEQVK